MFGAAVKVQADGKIVAAGGASAGGGSDACLVRLNGNDGSLDTGFGSSGVKVVSLGSGPTPRSRLPVALYRSSAVTGSVASIQSRSCCATPGPR